MLLRLGVLVALVVALSAGAAAARSVFSRSPSAVHGAVLARYAHTVCWYNRSLAPGQCAWIAHRILGWSAAFGVDPRFVLAVIAHESRFNHRAISHAGAIGLGQLMPGTARGMGLDPRDPEQNVYGAVRKLAALAREFGRADLAAAAYNAGRGAVRRWGGVPPFRETRMFVWRVTITYNHLRQHPWWDPNLGP
jgi:soluble lytic murein transglycosylase-like protein